MNTGRPGSRPVAVPQKDRGRQDGHQGSLNRLMSIFDQVKAIRDLYFFAFRRSRGIGARPIPTETRGGRKGLEDRFDHGFGRAPHDDQHPMGFLIQNTVQPLDVSPFRRLMSSTASTRTSFRVRFVSICWAAAALTYRAMVSLLIVAPSRLSASSAGLHPLNVLQPEKIRHNAPPIKRYDGPHRAGA